MNFILAAGFAIGGTFALAYLPKFSPLLTLSRLIDNIRAEMMLLGLCWKAMKDERDRMRESCLARARRER